MPSSTPFRPRHTTEARGKDLAAAAPQREWLRATFNDAAELHDRACPTYLPDLLADLIALARIGLGNRVLEIGCGTGQLNVPLA